ncbi:helix-turn-helix transcriptional regulator [Saccharothrix variisporea]|uniref:Excisionase family DNA binding protein n=1 Tax=Saccharothrix variisporea TaxID=543527 RepID=A0A495WZN5_9PSEU|nr:helix-turn-helix domain-containing protein [Saccharothrix variisporea]RKT67080.1 excisionase family DNA binding protein [Saccharothrix variisporea]
MSHTVERLLTLSEVSEQTGIPEATLRYWRAIGSDGPDFRRVGRRLRVTESALKAWMDRRMNDPAA